MNMLVAAGFWMFWPTITALIQELTPEGEFVHANTFLLRQCREDGSSPVPLSDSCTTKSVWAESRSPISRRTAFLFLRYFAWCARDAT